MKDLVMFKLTVNNDRGGYSFIEQGKYIKYILTGAESGFDGVNEGDYKLYPVGDTDYDTIINLVCNESVKNSVLKLFDGLLEIEVELVNEIPTKH